VDEWRETRSRNALAARARASILEEIRSNETELRNTRDNNRALLRTTEEALSRIVQKRDASLQFHFEIALLSSAAWNTAQMTQAANYLDFDWLRRVSDVYELQGLYLTSQSAVVDRISGISEILEDDPRRMLTIVAERLQVALKVQDSLLEEVREGSEEREHREVARLQARQLVAAARWRIPVSD
jgi:predicted house-cleaning noncanonical NTP pyrophosphatase (MazG superfamily)